MITIALGSRNPRDRHGIAVARFGGAVRRLAATRPDIPRRPTDAGAFFPVNTGYGPIVCTGTQNPKTLLLFLERDRSNASTPDARISGGTDVPVRPVRVKELGED